MKNLDLKEIAKYANQYVATSSDSLRIYASGKTVSQVEEQLEAQNITDAVIGFIPSLDKAISPLCL